MWQHGVVTVKMFFVLSCIMEAIRAQRDKTTAQNADWLQAIRQPCGTEATCKQWCKDDSACRRASRVVAKKKALGQLAAKRKELASVHGYDEKGLELVDAWTDLRKRANSENKTAPHVKKIGPGQRKSFERPSEEAGSLREPVGQPMLQCYHEHY